MTESPLFALDFSEITKEQHLHWCKDRALAYININWLQAALVELEKDLLKHPETAHLAEKVHTKGADAANARYGAIQKMRRFISELA